MTFNLANYKTGWTITAIGILWSGAYAVISRIWELDLLQGIGPTAVVTVFFIIYDKWLWRVRGFSLLCKVPDIRGEFTGRVTYSYDGEKSDKDCSMFIKQSCSHIKVTCEFSKDGEPPTRSESKEALITTDSIGDQELVFVYENEGSNMGSDTLAGHQGTNVLRIQKEKETTRLSGFYYTNRKPKQTQGTIKVLQHKTK